MLTVQLLQLLCFLNGLNYTEIPMLILKLPLQANEFSKAAEIFLSTSNSNQDRSLNCRGLPPLTLVYFRWCHTQMRLIQTRVQH